MKKATAILAWSLQVAKNVGRKVAQSRVGLWAFAFAVLVGSQFTSAKAAFVTVDVDGDLTFAPLEIVIKLLNAAVAGAEAAIPLLILGGGIYVIMRMFGLVGGVKKR